MQNKIDIPGTTITLEIVDKNITVTNKIKYDIQMQFKNQDAEPSLDESGDIFEPYKNTIALLRQSWSKKIRSWVQISSP